MKLLYLAGENAIVIVAGANMLLTVQDIHNAATLIASSKVLICQLEIDRSVTFAALALAHKHGGRYALCIMQLVSVSALEVGVID